MERGVQTGCVGEKSLLRVLAGARESAPPVWLMRQAGRYLPEYRAVREKAGGFLDLCFNPELAADVTLQPVRRFGFDAAILFSDILVVPLALGRKLWFVEGEGPRLEPLLDAKALMSVQREMDGKLLAPIYETVRQVKAELASKTALIGFCGAPWTVATYMVAGQGTPDQSPAKTLAALEPKAFQYLIDCLVDASADYLAQQLQAGALSGCIVLEELGRADQSVAVTVSVSGGLAGGMIASHGTPFARLPRCSNTWSRRSI